MNNFEIIVLIVSVLAIIISLFTIWLAMMFYKLYSHLSLLITEMNKGLEMSTLRLERIPKILYNQDISLSGSSVKDSQTSKGKKGQEDKQHPDTMNSSQIHSNENESKMQDKSLSSQISSTENNIEI